MRLATALAFALSMGFTLSAQQPGCAPCLDSAAHSVLPGHVVCLSSSEMASHIAIRKPVGPPGLNEPRMRIDGVVVACLRFAPSGKVTDVSIVSGPAMAQPPVLESMKDWTFHPVSRGGRRYGGCGTLQLRYLLEDGEIATTIEH